MTASLQHSFGFDPTGGMALQQLLTVAPPLPPADFAPFWRHRHESVLPRDPAPQLRDSPLSHPGWRVREITYRSGGDFPIQGWLLEPARGEVRRALVVGHGYGGREAPDFDLPVTDTALLFPCFRGLSRSARAPISTDPAWHVLHDIDSRDAYILGGCVEDVWLAASSLISLYPHLSGRIGYAGISFGGGIGALALAWDDRFDRGHLRVPTFGHQPLRLTLPSTGSAAALQAYRQRNTLVLEVLRYYDAASAAMFIRQPMLVAAALFDPAVNPPGQFAIYNALRRHKELFILEAGHFDYPGMDIQELQLRDLLRRFFAIPDPDLAAADQPAIC